MEVDAKALDSFAAPVPDLAEAQPDRSAAMKAEMDRVSNSERIIMSGVLT